MVEAKKNLIGLPPESSNVQKLKRSFQDTQAVNWAIEAGLINTGDIYCAETSPTFRCPQSCNGCPDGVQNTRKRILNGEIPQQEIRAPIDILQERLVMLKNLGIKHNMLIGGTIDNDPNLPTLVNTSLNLGMNVSWFTDMIPQIDENGQSTSLLEKNLKAGWIKKVATHLSIDYHFDSDKLPSKKQHSHDDKFDPEHPRKFKSQYGYVGAKTLIENNVKRVVINTTISHNNIDQILQIYNDVQTLQEYAESVNSLTEVYWTFSPWIWRPHQARGDDPMQNPALSGLQYQDMEEINNVFQQILIDTQQRIQTGKPRIAANSSGYLSLMVNSNYQQIVVEQNVPYNQGHPEMLAILPDGTVWTDPMFAGQELVAVRSIFGYRDRDPRQNKNPFTIFQDSNQTLFPNLVAL